MTSTSITPIRDVLISHILESLNPHKFQRTDDIFESLRYIVRPGGRMIINGVVYDEPPVQIPFMLHIELHGTGSISSPDGREEHFELVSFGVKVGNEYRGESVNIYYDTVEEFDKYLNLYFNL